MSPRETQKIPVSDEHAGCAHAARLPPAGLGAGRRVVGCGAQGNHTHRDRARRRFHHGKRPREEELSAQAAAASLGGEESGLRLTVALLAGVAGEACVAGVVRVAVVAGVAVVAVVAVVAGSLSLSLTLTLLSFLCISLLFSERPDRARDHFLRHGRLRLRRDENVRTLLPRGRQGPGVLAVGYRGRKVPRLCRRDQHLFAR